MPQYTYETDVRDLSVQPKPRFTDGEMDCAFGRDEATKTGEELDAADRAERASIDKLNGKTGGVVGPADPAAAAELYDHYSD